MRMLAVSSWEGCVPVRDRGRTGTLGRAAGAYRPGPARSPGAQTGWIGGRGISKSDEERDFSLKPKGCLEPSWKACPWFIHSLEGGPEVPAMGKQGGTWGQGEQN